MPIATIGFAVLVLSLVSSTREGRAEVRAKLNRYTWPLAPFVIIFWGWVAWVLLSPA